MCVASGVWSIACMCMLHLSTVVHVASRLWCMLHLHVASVLWCVHLCASRGQLTDKMVPRYLSRGIDDDGNVSNAVESEQVIFPCEHSHGGCATKEDEATSQDHARPHQGTEEETDATSPHPPPSPPPEDRGAAGVGNSADDARSGGAVDDARSGATPSPQRLVPIGTQASSSASSSASSGFTSFVTLRVSHVCVVWCVA